MTMKFRVHKFIPYKTVADDVNAILVMVRSSVKNGGGKKTFFFVGEAHNGELDVLRRTSINEAIYRDLPEVTMVIERGMNLKQRVNDVVEEPSKLSPFDDLRNRFIAKEWRKSNPTNKHMVTVFLFGNDHHARIQNWLETYSKDDEDEICNWVSIDPYPKKADEKLVEMKMASTCSSSSPDGYTFCLGSPEVSENLLKLSNGMTTQVFNMRLYSSEVIRDVASRNTKVYGVYIKDPKSRDDSKANDEGWWRL